ncbi:MAG: hypothetical protein JXA11_16005 [Phycisphaerae bacterium]|nr:hypothetical protein [Phycisphaerae bacterium]
MTRPMGLTLRLLNVLVLGLLPVLSCGCPVAAWTATLFPPDKVPAQYDLDETSTALVLVEDPRHLSDRTTLKTQMSEFINRELEDRGLVERVIPYRQLMNLAAATNNFRTLSVAEVGKKLRADIVLYVEIDRFSLRDDPSSPFWHGKLTTRVKVISVKEGRLWPKELPEGYSPARVDTGSVSGEGSLRFEQHLVQNMARDMGDNVTKLFYEHRGKEHGSLPDDDDIDRP